MEPAGGVRAGGPDVFRHGGGEGEDVVAEVELQFVDTADGETGVGAQLRGGGRGDNTGGSQGFGCGEFDPQPAVEFCLVGPERGHSRAGVAGNHQHSTGWLKLRRAATPLRQHRSPYDDRRTAEGV